MNHTLSHRIADYECVLCWFSWSLEFTNWWRRLDLIRDMCCWGPDANEKHSEGEVEEWMAPESPPPHTPSYPPPPVVLTGNNINYYSSHRIQKQKNKKQKNLKQGKESRSQGVSWPRFLNYQYSQILEWHLGKTRNILHIQHESKECVRTCVCEQENVMPMFK